MIRWCDRIGALGAVGPTGTAPLHIAAQRGDLGVVTLLLEASADLTAVDRNGQVGMQSQSQSRVTVLCTSASPSDLSLGCGLRRVPAGCGSLWHVP